MYVAFNRTGTVREGLEMAHIEILSAMCQGRCIAIIDVDSENASTSNDNDGAKTSASTPTEVDGIIGKAQDYTSATSGEVITVNANTSIANVFDGGGRGAYAG